MKGALAVVVALATASCYHPSIATDVPCSAKGECPNGQTCDFGRSPPTCVAVLGDAGSAMPDAPPDAAPACIDNSSCAAGAPICDQASHTCRGCVADADCATITGGACTEYNGQCIADADTIYVAITGTDLGTCTSTAPCATIAFALTQVAGTRLVLAIADGSYPGVPGSPAASINSTVGRIVLSGAKLDYAGGPVLSAMTDGTTNPAVVQESTGDDVVLEGLTVMNGGTDGIRSSGALLLSHVDVDTNGGRGLNANPANSAATHIWSSRIAHNTQEGIFVQNGPLEILRSEILDNHGGGVNMRSGALVAISSIVGGNGGTGTQIGGFLLQNLGGRVPRLDFLTIANNQTKQIAGSPGLGGDNSAAIAISNSITSGNTAQNVATPPQICSGCTATYTLFSGTPAIGTGNVTGAPGFVDAATLDFHITSASAAHGGADPAANVHYDVDGETRPQGSFDMGADEIP